MPIYNPETDGPLSDYPTPPERGFVGETIAGFKRGGLQLVDMLGNAARAVDPEGGVDVVRNIGKSFSDYARERQTRPDVAPSAFAEKHPYLNYIPQAAERAIPSVGIPLAAGGAALAAGASAPVATVLGAGAALGAFGVSQFQDTKERGIEAGLSKEEATKAGLKTGLIEGLGEAVSDIIPAAKIFKLGKPVEGQIVKSLFKTPLKQTAKRLVNDAAQIAVGEVGTEMGQNYFEAQVEKNAGIRPDANPWGEAVSATGPTIGLSLLLGGVVGGGNKFHRVVTEKALTDPRIRQENRLQAVDSVYSTLSKVPNLPEGAAERWQTKAVEAVRNGETIPLTDEWFAPPAVEPVKALKETLAEFAADPGRDLNEILTEKVSPTETHEQAIYQMVNPETGEVESVPNTKEAMTLARQRGYSLIGGDTDGQVQGQREGREVAQSEEERIANEQARTIEDRGVGQTTAATHQTQTGPETVSEMQNVDGSTSDRVPAMQSPYVTAIEDGGVKYVEGTGQQQAVRRDGDTLTWLGKDSRGRPNVIATAEILPDGTFDINEAETPEARMKALQVIAKTTGFPVKGTETRFNRTQNNASGESAASLEALSRARSEAPRYVVDVRTGKGTPLRGVDAVDFTPAPFQMVMQRDSQGQMKVVAEGDKVSPGARSRVTTRFSRVDENRPSAEIIRKFKEGTLDLSNESEAVRVGFFDAIHSLTDPTHVRGSYDLVEDASLRSNMSRLAGLFGHSVTLLSSSSPTRIGGWVSKYDPKHIYIVVNSKVGTPLQILGHELVHQIKNNDLDLYKELGKGFIELQDAEGVNKYFATIQPGEFDPKTGVTTKTGTEDWVADVVGANFGSEGFWSAFAEVNPSLFERVAKAANDLLNYVLDNISARFERASKTVTDIKKAEQVTARVLGKYAEARAAATRFARLSEADIKELNILRPALKVGDRTLTGLPGEAHITLAERNGARSEYLKGTAEQGFIDPTGRFHPLNKAGAWIKDNDPETHKFLKNSKVVDSVDYAYAKGLSYDSKYNRGEAGGVSKADIETSLKDVLPKLKIPVVVVESSSMIPDFQDPGFAFNGVFHDGSIYLVASQMKSVKESHEVLLDHEVRHAGLRVLMGRAFDRFLGTAWSDKGADIRAFAEAKGIDYRTKEGKLEATEEYIVELAKGEDKSPLLDKFLARLRAFLREIGFNLRLTDVELRALVARAGEVMFTKGEQAEGLNTRYNSQGTPLAWFSKLEKHLDEKTKNLKGDKEVPATHFMSLLKDQKKDELEETGILDFLKENPRLTKSQLMDFLAEGRLDLRDVILGVEANKERITELNNEYGMATRRQRELAKADQEDSAEFDALTKRKEEIKAELEKAVEQPTHFSQYTEPGAVPGSYREMFVTAPAVAGMQRDPIHNKYLFKLEKIIAGRAEGIAYASTLEEAQIMKERFLTSGYDEVNINQNTPSWQDGHSQYADIQNPVVRIRFNERLSEGKRTLFVEEMQGPSDANQEKMPAFLRSRIYDLGVKRILAYAKANGFDAVAWTTGEMQAERYDLSKQVDSIGYIKNEEGNFDLSVMKDGSEVFGKEDVPASELEDIVGKEVAAKIVGGEGKRQRGDVPFKMLSGLDLKVGGEGLKRLYDQTLPVLFKKYGGEEVRSTKIDTTSHNWLHQKTEYEGPTPSIDQVQTAYDAAKAYGRDDFVSPITGERMMFPINRVANEQSLREILKAMKAGMPFDEAIVTYGGDPEIFGGTTTSKSVPKFATIQSIPITDRTPYTQPLFNRTAKAKEFLKNAQETIFNKNDFGRMMTNAANSFFNVFMAVDRGINMARSSVWAQPISPLLGALAEIKVSKQNHAKQRDEDGNTKAAIFNKAFKTKEDLQKANDVVFKQTLYQLDAENLDAAWAGQEDEWKPVENNKYAPAKTLDEAKDDLNKAYNRLTLEQKKAVVIITNHVKQVSKEYREAILGKLQAVYGEDAATFEKRRNEIMAQMKNLRGVYFPLMRFGDYMVRGFELNEDGSKSREVKMEKFTTMGEALRAQEKYATEGLHAEVDRDMEDSGANFTNVPSHFIASVEKAAAENGLSGEEIDEFKKDLQRLWVGTLSPNTVEGHKLMRKGIEGFSESLMQSYAAYVSRTAVATANTKYGWQIAQKYKEMKEVIEDLKAPGKNHDQEAILRMQGLVNKLEATDQVRSQERTPKIVRALNKLVFAMMLSSPSAWLVQFSQPLMFTLPKLSSRFGGTASAAALYRNFKRYMSGSLSNERIDQWNRENGNLGDEFAKRIERAMYLDSEIRKNNERAGRTDSKELAAELNKTLSKERGDIDKYLKKTFEALDPEGRRMLWLRVAQLRGSLDLSSSFEFQDTAQGTSKAERIGNKAVEAAGFFMRKGETGSRKATALAGMDLAYKGDFIEAMNYTLREVIDDTLYNMSQENRPPIAKGAVGKLVFQFQFFRFHTLGKVIQLAMDAAGKDFNRRIEAAGGDKALIEDAYRLRSEARKELAYMTVIGTALAGAAGTPLALLLSNSATKMLFNAIAFMFEDEDDPWDLERDFSVFLHENLGDTMANALEKGLPSLVGLDISKRIGTAGMADLIQGEPPAGMTPGQESAWYANRMLGPWWSMLTDQSKAINALKEGDYGDAIKYSSPSFVKAFFKTYDLAENGVTTTSGKTLLPAEDVSMYSIGLMLTGINPLEVSLAREDARELSNLSVTITRRRSKLLKDYAEAVVKDDFDAKEEALEKISSWGESQPRLKISYKELATATKRALIARRGGKVSRKDEILKEQYLGGE